MYYEDQSRRFNLVSGLLSGAVLGAGVALLLRPDTDRVRRIGRSASRRLDGLREELGDTLQETVRAGRTRLGR
jgi:gas vesicle protein